MKKIKLDNGVTILAKTSTAKSTIYRNEDVVMIHVYSGEDETKNNQLLFIVSYGGIKDRRMVMGGNKRELDVFEISIFMEVYERFWNYYTELSK